MATLNLADLDLSNDEDRAKLEAALADNERLEAENEELKASDKEVRIDSELDDLKVKLGLEEQPGLLKFIRRVKLSDDGEPAAVLLADDENKKEESITASDVIDKFIALLPKNQEGKLQLSEAHLMDEAGTKPADKSEGENDSESETLQAAYDILGTKREVPKAWTNGGDN